MLQSEQEVKMSIGDKIFWIVVVLTVTMFVGIEVGSRLTFESCVETQKSAHEH